MVACPFSGSSGSLCASPGQVSVNAPGNVYRRWYKAQTEQQVILAAASNGNLTALAHTGISDTCEEAIGEFVEPFTKTAPMMYAYPNMRLSQQVVRLNRQPTFMRAPGEVSGTYALESAFDELAYKLRLDPIELRLRNHADTAPDTNLPWSSKSLKECYQLGAEKFG